MGLLWKSVPDSEPLEKGERFREAAEISLTGEFPDFLRGELDNVFPEPGSDEWQQQVENGEQRTNDRLGSSTNIEVTSAGYTRPGQTTWKFRFEYRVTKGDGTKTVGEIEPAGEVGTGYSEYINKTELYQEKFSMVRVGAIAATVVLVAVAAGVVSF